MSQGISKELEDLLAYIKEAVKSGRFVDEEAAMARTLELLRGDEKASALPTQRRQGGQWKGQVTIAPDFNDLPDDIAESFGIQ